MLTFIGRKQLKQVEVEDLYRVMYSAHYNPLLILIASVFVWRLPPKLADGGAVCGLHTKAAKPQHNFEKVTH